MNKVILMGRLTRDPEVRYSQSAEPLAIARYTLAINRRFKRQGESEADFIPCVAFGKQGEFAERYFRKGQMVSVVGRLQVRNGKTAKAKSAQRQRSLWRNSILRKAKRRPRAALLLQRQVLHLPRPENRMTWETDFTP